MSEIKGVSGKQQAEENVLAFAAWLAGKTDDEFRAMASRGVLSRKEISIECGFAKSVLDQNPRVKAALRELEDNLRRRGVLPPAIERDPNAPVAPLMREPSRLRAAQETERLRRLEQENASLRAEVAELKRTLARLAVLRDALALTGRLPR
jgi:hypothetical protein